MKKTQIHNEKMKQNTKDTDVTADEVSNIFNSEIIEMQMNKKATSISLM